MTEPAKPKGRRASSRQRDLADELKRQTGQLAAINAVTTAVSQSLDLSVTLETALDAVLSVIPVEASGISMIDEAAGELVLRAQRGWRKDFVTEPMRIKMGHGMSWQVINNDEVLITGDVTNDPRLAVPAFSEEKVQAMVMAPMHARGRVVGVLSVMNHKPYKFDKDEVKILQAIADQVGLALDNARLYESVREQQSRLQAILQSTADAIIATDNQGKINLINEAAKTLFQLDTRVIGQPLRDVALPFQMREKLHIAMDRENLSGALQFEVPLDNGRFLASIVSPVYSQPRLDQRQAEGWVAVFQDVTHLKEAERARLQFIQTAAHDLRNPLGVTLSALTMLSKNWKDPTVTEREVFNIALQGINRMQDLIDDLLNLEHIESGVDFRHEPFNMPRLVEQCVTEMGPMLQRKEQSLRLVVDQNLPPYNGDERWLYRALTNLISNAHKYTQRGSTITVRAEAHGSALVLQVEDNGPGIPPEAQGRLFERFYRVRSTEEKIQGTGLGLAIVKSVAEKHQGRVFVNSEPGQGSTFGMILPCQVGEAETNVQAG
jgi:two-component system phosphate regulon sensor histidine kinase PhoR